MTRAELIPSGSYYALPKSVLASKRHTANEKLVFAALIGHDFSKSKTEGCFPSYDRIAECVGVSSRTVANAVPRLCKLKQIARERKNMHPRAKPGTRTPLYRMIGGKKNLSPFVAVPKAIAAIPSRHLSPSAKLVWSQIVEFFNTSDHCWDSLGAIGKAVGLNRRTVLKAVKELEQKQAIQVERRPGGTYELSNWSIGTLRNKYRCNKQPSEIASMCCYVSFKPLVNKVVVPSLDSDPPITEQAKDSILAELAQQWADDEREGIEEDSSELDHDWLTFLQAESERNSM